MEKIRCGVCEWKFADLPTPNPYKLFEASTDTVALIAMQTVRGALEY